VAEAISKDREDTLKDLEIYFDTMEIKKRMLRMSRLFRKFSIVAGTEFAVEIYFMRMRKAIH